MTAVVAALALVLALAAADAPLAVAAPPAVAAPAPQSGAPLSPTLSPGAAGGEGEGAEPLSSAAAAPRAPLAPRGAGGEGEGRGGPVSANANPAPLSAWDAGAARVAWRYFERNYHPETGLVSSVDGYPSTTAWDVGSTIFATIAARDLGLLAPDAFDLRVATLLGTLGKLPLFEGELPNKAYDARTGAMTDYANHPAPSGIGFSATDLGRLTAALSALAARHPQHREGVERALRRWTYCRLLGDGELHGALVEDGRVRIVQEGRHGYEQYAAAAFTRLGLDVSRAARLDHRSAETPILGVPIRHDVRDPRVFGAMNPVSSEPWILGALEAGRDPEREPLLRRVFEVQRRRWEQTGVVTALSEDHVDAAPWFVYGAIWAGGEPWRALGPSGEDMAAFRGVSTKAAFALATLFPQDPYANVLVRAIAPLANRERGWLAGTYERGGVNRALTANTNGVILEALLYKAAGPLHPPGVPAAALRLAGGPQSGACLPGTAEAARAAAMREGAGGALAMPAFPAPAPAPSSPGAPPSLRANAGSSRSRPIGSGDAFLGYRGVDRGLAGGVVTLTPWRSLFFRGGAEVMPFSPGGDVRLLWGFGFDDWRDPFFLHVHNWGPIYLGYSSPTEAAEVATGWRLPRACAGGFCLSPVAIATVPFAGGPHVGGRLHLDLGSKLFAMAGLSWTVPGIHEGPAGTPEWRFVYGFGHRQWTSGAPYVEYYDWGPTTRSHNGVLAVGVRWAY